MARQHKIKHYHKSNFSYKKGPHPLMILLWIVILAALVFIGISIYQPVYNLIMGEYSFFNIEEPPEVPSSLPEEGDTGESQPDAQPEPEPEPVVMEVSGLRVVYLPMATALDEALLDSFLAELEGTEITGVMVDLKDKTGTVLFNTSNQNAIDWGAVSETPLNLGAFARRLEGAGLQLVTRISAFNDQTAANGNRENAIRYQGGDWLWLDNAADAGGKAWLNPFAQGAQEYVRELAVEAASAGAALVVLEDVQFADNSSSANATFGEEATSEQRQRVLREFIADTSQAVKDAGSRMGVYVPANNATEPANTQNEVRYGGNPLRVMDDLMILGLLPYQFTTGFSQGGLEISAPLENPAATAETAMTYILQVMEENSDISGNIEILPLIQGGAESNGAYTREQLVATVNAVEGQGAKAYVLYQSGGSYLLR